MVSAKRAIRFLALMTALVVLRNFSMLTVEVDAVFELGPLPKGGPVIEPKWEKNGTVVNRLTHQATFGLGHRLCRASAAYHLAKSLNLTRIRFRWGDCGNSSGAHIFPYLFGSEDWVIPSNKSPGYGVNILVRNDVYGYIPGQSLKDAERAISPRHRQPDGPFLQKIASDTEFFKLLSNHFVHRNRVDEFMAEHRFRDHTVLGLHLRAGNGEESHFKESGRFIDNETEFVSNLMDVVQELTKYLKNLQKKPPLLFLATDTAYLVPSVQQASLGFGVKTVVLPQFRPEKNTGVTFLTLQGAGEKCLVGWQDMVSDSLLLGHADVLIAARHSTFTQSLPLSLVFDRMKNVPGPHFCEVSVDAKAMSCYQDLSTWLFRDLGSNFWNIALPGAAPVNGSVYHKLVVQLPDLEPAPEYDEVVNVLQSRGNSESFLLHTYGEKRFFMKYRGKKFDSALNWTFS